MIDTLLDLVRHAITSPWVYAALFLLAALDGFFPVVPGETAVVTVSVFAATADPNLILIIGASALGAFAGDHTSYLIGRSATGPLSRRIRQGTRRQAAFAWVDRALARRGASVLVGSRLIPGVRTGTTMTMGVIGYPLHLFSLYDSLAATIWASYWALLGYLGGTTFENEPLKGLALALCAAFAFTGLFEAGRRILQRRRAPQHREHSCH